ncbi:MAG: YciI family protein [Pseudomonadota bacterium]
MIYAVLFEDNDAAADKRPQFMPDHLTFLERNSSAIQAAGPMADGQSGDPAGGLWLVEAPDANTVKALVEEDPFWPTGLRKSVRILLWKQVFADGQRQI